MLLLVISVLMVMFVLRRSDFIFFSINPLLNIFLTCILVGMTSMFLHSLEKFVSVTVNCLNIIKYFTRPFPTYQILWKHRREMDEWPCLNCLMKEVKVFLIPAIKIKKGKKKQSKTALLVFDFSFYKIKIPTNTHLNSQQRPSHHQAPNLFQPKHRNSSEIWAFLGSSLDSITAASQEKNEFAPGQKRWRMLETNLLAEWYFSFCSVIFFLELNMKFSPLKGCLDCSSQWLNHWIISEGAWSFPTWKLSVRSH